MKLHLPLARPLVALPLALLLVLPGALSASATTPLGVTDDFVTLDAGTQPTSLAIDADGNVYVASYIFNTITKVTPAGTRSLYATLEAGSKPSSIAIQPDGTLVTADKGNDKVAIIPRPASPGTPATPRYVALATGASPKTLALDSLGNIYVNGDYQHQVSRLAPSTTTAGSYDRTDYVLGKALYPTEAAGYVPTKIVADSHGALFVLNQNAIVSKITPATGAIVDDFSFLRRHATTFSGWDLAIDSHDQLFVSTAPSGPTNPLILSIDPTSGGTPTLFATLPIGGNANGLTFDKEGSLYATVSATSSVFRTPSMLSDHPAVPLTPLATFPGFSSMLPSAISGSGRLYAADYTRGTVRRVVLGPQITSPAPGSTLAMTTGSPVSVDITVSGIEPGVVSSISTLPTGVSITSTPDASVYRLSGTPTQTGTFVVDLDVANAIGHSTAQVTVVVTPGLRPAGRPGTFRF